MKMHARNYYNPFRFFDRATPLNKILATSILFILIGFIIEFLELAIVGGFVLLIFVVYLYSFAKCNIR